MYIVLLRFTGDRSRAGEFVAAHEDWVRRGFDDGCFLLVGTLQPALGGAILAHTISRQELTDRLAEDPFVAEGLVTPEILELAPGRADKRLEFLLA